MKNLCTLLSIVSMFFIQACGAQSPYNYNPTEKIIQYSKIGEIQTVRNGDSIIHYQVETVCDALDVKRNIRGGFMTPVFIPKGIYEKNGVKGNNEFFNPVSIKGDRVSAGNWGVLSIKYNNENNSISLDLAGEVLAWSEKDGFQVVRNQRLKKVGEDYNMRSLNYAGSHDKLVSFEYREGSNSQRVTHNMNTGNIFRYAGAEIEIINHDDYSLSCKVIKEFDIFN